MHSVSDLTTSSRKTSGTVPPKLVGASTTIMGDKMYLFGGRLVAERRMVSDLFVFDLETFVWTKVPPYAGDDVPGARYFHSADSWQNYLIIFGGMGHKPEAASSDDLVVLNDVRFFDITTFRWLPAEPQSPATDGTADPIDPVTSTSESGNEFTPRARYAHLSSVNGARLYVVGGQDLQNAWLDDICVYDLRARRWAARRPYPRHAGTYRSVAVAAQLRVRDPSREKAEDRTALNSDSNLGPPGGRFSVDRRPSSGKGEYTPSENLVHLPYSTEPTEDYPNEIFLYSNYNFTDVKRELEVFTPKPGSAADFDMSDRSVAMTGAVLPPGLRFPTGAICGNHLIFAGTYLAHSYQSYSIWALDLTTMTWSRLDPGAALSTGSWFRAALWNSPAKGTSSLLIFGSRQGSLVEDYNRRLLAWDDVAVLDLEAFGIYQPPQRQLDERAQELGLAGLEEGLMADFEVVCDDGRRISCSRRLLEARWPWFRDQRRLLRDATTRAISSSQELSGSAAAAPPLPPDDELLPTPVPMAVGQHPDARPDPRMTPRGLMLGEPYAVALALLQYFYTLSVLTPLQHAPAVLSQLLLLGAAYNLPHLQRLVRHAMHRALAPSTSVGVYEVATLCGCQSLQIRALKAVMASSRRNTGRARGNSNAGGGNGAPPPRGGGGGGPGDRDRSNTDRDALGPGARARGMSDTRGLGFAPYSGTGGGGGVRDAGIGRTGLRTNGTESRRAVNSEAMWPEDVVSDVDADADLDGEGDSELSGKETEENENRANTATPTTASAALARRQRIKHSVNLSMDSIYLALQAADENDSSTSTSSVSSPSDVERSPDSVISPWLPEFGLNIPSMQLPLSSSMPPPTSPSVLSPVPRSPDVDLDEELRQESLRERSKGKDVETASVASGTSHARRRAYTALADLAIPSLPLPPRPPSVNSYQTSINASPRSSLLISTTSMYASNSTPSPSSAGGATPVHQYPPRLGLTRQNSLTADDSDRAGRSTSSRSARPSPLTPDSPPLPTPDGDHEPSSQFSLNRPFSLDTISETDGMMYEVMFGKPAREDKHHSSLTPPLSPSAPSLGNARSQDSHRSSSSAQSAASTSYKQANGHDQNNARHEHLQFVDIVEPESDGRTGWADLRAPRAGITFADSKTPPRLQHPYQQTSPAANSPQPVTSPTKGAPPPPSPRTSTFAASIRSGFSTASSEKRTSGGSSPNTVTGSSAGIFLSKARIKTKKKTNGSAPSPNGSPLSPTFTGIGIGAVSPFVSATPSITSRNSSVLETSSITSGWSDGRDVKKAAKAEEKRRRKAEEKARLEALAAQFSQHRKKSSAKDGVSVVSSGSAERRRAANEWVEDSAGMYGGGSVMVWGGL